MFMWLKKLFKKNNAQGLDSNMSNDNVDANAASTVNA